MENAIQKWSAKKTQQSCFSLSLNFGAKYFLSSFGLGARKRIGSRSNSKSHRHNTTIKYEIFPAPFIHTTKQLNIIHNSIPKSNKNIHRTIIIDFHKMWWRKNGGTKYEHEMNDGTLFACEWEEPYHIDMLDIFLLLDDIKIKANHNKHSRSIWKLAAHYALIGFSNAEFILLQWALSRSFIALILLQTLRSRRSEFATASTFA